jgi:TetR/AcrR family transcriptional regulator, tetracycline repressor protein
MAGRPPTASKVTKAGLLDAAVRIAESEGLPRLTMRRLAAEFGVAVTAIYWHVGNREALVEALVEREIADMGAIRPSGRAPEDRLISVARSLRRKLLARPHLISLVNERGLTPLMFLPAQAVLARELAAGGLTDEAAAMAVRSIQYHVIGSVILERWNERSPDQPTDDRWRHAALAAGVDAGVAGHLARALAPEAVFEFSTGALVRALLAVPRTIAVR